MEPCDDISEAFRALKRAITEKAFLDDNKAYIFDFGGDEAKVPSRNVPKVWKPLTTGTQAVGDNQRFRTLVDGEHFVDRTAGRFH